jgi:hypothetical protein
MLESNTLSRSHIERLQLVGQLAQISRRHELRQRVEVIARHRAVFVGGGVGRAVSVEQILLRGDEQSVGLGERNQLRAKIIDVGARRWGAAPPGSGGSSSA